MIVLYQSPSAKKCERHEPIMFMIYNFQITFGRRKTEPRSSLQLHGTAESELRVSREGGVRGKSEHPRCGLICGIAYLRTFRTFALPSPYLRLTFGCEGTEITEKRAALPSYLRLTFALPLRDSANQSAAGM